MVKKDPTIGLYGISGVYNYGCEAIVRGTEVILREKWPNVRIKYASLRPDDDKRRLKGTKIEVIPREIHNLYSAHRINEILAYKMGIYSKKLYHEDLGWVNECDTIFSIGGDIYTLPPQYQKKMFKPYYHPLVHFGEIVKDMNKKFVVWGASIGPFEKNPKAKKLFLKHLNKVDLITSREPSTTSYLKEIGITKNVVEFPDPAFFVSSDQYSRNSDRKVVGINLSPLSTYFDLNDPFEANNIKKQGKIIVKIINELDVDVLLIPHVFCDFNILDDDLRYLKLIKNSLPPQVNKRVKLIDKDLGFIGIKRYMAECDLIMAARMHCAINSLSLGIPTIFLAYSTKALGMAEYFYCNNKWGFTTQNINNEKLLSSVKYMLAEKDALKTFIFERKAKINSKLNNNKFLTLINDR